MAVYLGEDRPTSAGPLDIKKNAGDDNVGLLNHDGDTANNAPLDPVRPDEMAGADEEILREKNPLGYTITPPTQAEIDGDK